MSAPGPLTTHVGRAEHDEHHFFGHRALGELAGKIPHIGLIALAVGGPLLNEIDCGALDDTATCLLFADPRVWPLKASRLVASHGSPLAGISAGLLCSEGALLGPRVAYDAAMVMTAIASTLGDSVDDPVAVAEQVRRRFEENPRFPGFGVPARERDERFVALAARLAARGRDQGRFVRMSRAMADEVWRIAGTPPNIALLTAALMLDVGIPAERTFALGVVLLEATIIANAVEGAAQRASSLQRLPDDVVRYEGKAPRTSPRAERAKHGT